MSKPCVEAMREIVSYLRSEYSAGRFPVPEHYVDTVEAALSTPAIEPANDHCSTIKNTCYCMAVIGKHDKSWHRRGK